MLKLFWAFPAVVVAFTLNVVFGAIPALIMRAVGLRKAADSWMRFHGAFISDFFLFVAGVKVEVTGDVQSLRTNKDSRICYIANHTSMMDILLMDGPLALGSGFICKQSLAWVFPVNLVAIALNSVFISRTSLKKSGRAIEKGVENIKKGSRMTIFPEGTRSRNGEIAPFKHGSFKLAFLSGADIVPITIKGVRAALEDRKSLFQRTTCHVHVGSPVRTEGFDRNMCNQAVADIEEGIKKVYATL